MQVMSLIEDDRDLESFFYRSSVWNINTAAF